MRFAPIVAFVHMAICGYIRVDIKSFTIEVVTNPAWKRQRAESGETRGTSGTTSPAVKYREEQQLSEETTTVEQPTDNCRFRFPERKHVDGILSDMMNQLARMYVKTDEFISTQVSKQMRNLWATDEVRRAVATRYKLVRDRRKSFFDELFNNMTSEYSKVFNASESGSAAGACPPQDAARRRWWELLERAARSLARAAGASAARQLAERGVAARSWLARQLRRHVARERRQLPTRLLRALCDSFRLCYQDDFLPPRPHAEPHDAPHDATRKDRSGPNLGVKSSSSFLPPRNNRRSGTGTTKYVKPANSSTADLLTQTTDIRP